MGQGNSSHGGGGGSLWDVDVDDQLAYSNGMTGGFVTPRVSPAASPDHVRQPESSGSSRSGLSLADYGDDGLLYVLLSGRWLHAADSVVSFVCHPCPTALGCLSLCF